MEKIWLEQYDPGVPETLNYPEQNLFTFLEQAAAGKCEDKPALEFQGSIVKYGQLLRIVNRLSGALKALGLKKGERCALQLPTCPQFIIAYYAILKLGAIVVPLNPAYVARETHYCLEDSGAKLLITTKKGWVAIEKSSLPASLSGIIIADPEKFGLLAKSPARQSTVNGAAPKVNLSSGSIPSFQLEDLIKTAEELPRSVPEPADAAVIIYTGGKEGLPLGAVLSHGNLTANVLQCRCWNPALREEKHQTILLALPLSHSYGMTVGMNLGLAIAGHLILLPRFSPQSVLDLIEKNRVTYFPGVPAMFQAILESTGLQKHNLRSIKTCLSGGAPLPLDVQQSFELITGGKLIEGYGLTEASPVTHSNPYLGQRKRGSIGLPLPDTRIKVVDLRDEQKELPPGAVGEMWVKGPQVMQGYFNAAEETEQVLVDGWLRTGDIVRMEEDGFTYIVDRKKEFIISGGYNVYPGEVQAVLLAHPLVKNAVVSAIRDPYKGEALQVVITPASGASLTEEDVREYCKVTLAPFKHPRYIKITKAKL